MESKHLSYFKVENFKRFDSLEVKDIGQFNLIVGDNNVGKTSLLEALLFDEENYDQFLHNTWSVLEEYKKIKIPNAEIINYLDFYLKNKNLPIDYTFQYLDKDKNNTLSVKKRAKNNLSQTEIDKLNGLIKLHAGDKFLLEFSLNGISELKFLSYFDDGNYSNYFPFVGYSSMYNDALVKMFSQLIISTQKKDDFILSLKYFIPNLISIETNPVLIPQQTVVAVREAENDLIPLSEYGDGFIKLFRYLIEMDLHEDTRLMIDEIDTGIHYSRMKEFLKKVLQSAKNKNVQLFATTHSKECIQYYTQALEELNMQDSGRIIRIADTKIGIRAYTMGFEEFENAMIADGEIR
jgi:AAA15 family ATPase/GTPase